MKKLLFFDDYLVNRQRNIVRRWQQPQWMDEAAFTDESSPSGAGYASVVPQPGRGYYLYYNVALGFGKPDDSIAVCLAQSQDGLAWEKAGFAPPRREGFPQVVYGGDPVPNGCAVYYDALESDASRRYKMTEARRKSPYQCRLLHSADGLDWQLDTEHPFLHRFSDTMLSLVHNHRTGRYQVSLRDHWVDRRIFLVESADLKSWSEPQLVLHPTPLDAPMTEFYGMPQFRYGDMFLGFLWIYQTDASNPRWNTLEGRVFTELVYSYNGINWNRTHRPFASLRERGQYGGGSIYATAFLERENDMLVYANASRLEHGHYMAQPGDLPRNALLPGRLRTDGFVCLASGPGKGELTTATLYPRSPRLSLNLRAPFGGVRVQVCDPDCHPLPGYSFDNCQELRGDGVALQPRWKEHDDLSAALQMLENKNIVPSKPGWLRLQIEMEQAELYSINGDFGVSMIAPAPGEDYL